AMLLALLLGATAGLVRARAGHWVPWLPASAAIASVLFIERVCAGIQAWHRTGDRTALAFAITHLFRDIVWSAAIVVWMARWVLKLERAPAHSMLPHGRLGERAVVSASEVSILAVVPAYNEHANLPR